MVGAVNPPAPPSRVRRHGPGVRDRAFVTIRRVTAWVATGAVAATAVLVGVAAHDTPGHHDGGSAVTPPSGAGTNSSSLSGGGLSTRSAPSTGAPSFTNPAPSTGGVSLAPSTGSPQVATGQT